MDIKKFNDYHLNESSGDGKFSIENAKKYIKFFNKIKYLFVDVDIKLSFQEIFQFVRTSDKNAINPNLYHDIDSIIEDNKQEIQRAYDEVFFTSEEFLSSLLISVILGLSFYYAFSRGWFNKLFSKVDKLVGKRGGDGYEYDSARPDYGKKTIKQPSKSNPKLDPYKPLAPKKSRVDELLDKINRRGADSLTPEEKEYLRKNN